MSSPPPAPEAQLPNPEIGIMGDALDPSKRWVYCRFGEDITRYSPKAARRFAKRIRTGIHIDPALGELANQIDALALEIEQEKGRG